MARKKRWRNLYNFIFVTYFVRGEDCGKGVLDPLFKLFPRLTPFCWDLEVEVTTKCYLRCKMCERTFFPKDYASQDLSFAQLKEIIDGIPNLKWINLTGEGSAFLNHEFMDMVRYVKGKGIYLDFSHDFFRLSQNVMKELVELGVERMYVSMDGATKETYESIRVGSNFERVLANIRELLRIKRWLGSPLPEICFRYTFFRDNVNELPEFMDLIHSLGDAKDLGDEPSVNFVGLLEFEQTKDLVVELPQAIANTVNAKARKYGIKVYWSHVSHDENQKPPLDWCTFWSEPYIMIGGYMLPCCSVFMSNRRPFLEEHAMGNVNGRSLKEIWDSEWYKAFRKIVVNPKAPVPVLCAGCRVFNTAERIKKYGVMV